MEGVDLVNALSVVEARLAGTLISIDVAEDTLIARHTDTVEPSNLVQASGIIVAGIGHAFIDVHLTARSFIPLWTLALKRAIGVKAAATMFTGVGTKSTLINVQVAG